jgi:hypothetical protein
VGSRQLDGISRAALERIGWAERLSELTESLVLLRGIVYKSLERRREPLRVRTILKQLRDRLPT